MKFNAVFKKVPEGYNGCEFFREGGNHTIYVNRQTRSVAPVPRHRELNRFLVRKICKSLDIPFP